MSRYGNGDDTIARLKAEAHVADQVVEDLSRALEDSERVCDRYRRALKEIMDADPVDMALDPNWPARIARTAMWTKVEDR